MNYLSTAVAAIIAIILLTIVPAYRSYWMMDQQVLSFVNEETQQFVNNARHKAVISQDAYEYYLGQLAKTGNVYEVHIIHTKKVYYPLQPGDPGYSPTHTFEVVEEKFAEKRILDEIYATAQHEYRMKSGDSIVVEVQNRSKTGAMTFMGLMGGDGATSLIFSRFGGLITNEDY